MRSLLLVVLLASCATLGVDPTVKEARELVAAGRAEQALALLEKAGRENPQKHEYRAEYARTRDLAVAQWLVQAELLRQGGTPAPAAELYRRVQKHDPANARAALGLEQLEADTRHQAVVAGAE